MMKIVKVIMIFTCLLTVSETIFAQINPLKSQFFVNSFLINPSKAGAGERGLMSAGFSSQWNRIPGAPEIMSVTAESPITQRMGIGASVMNDKSGLINRTVVMGSYSYKVPFSESGSLRFGLSAGYISDNINISEAVTQNASSDPSLVNYNYQHENLFKAGFGATLSLKKLEVQTSWFSINRRVDPQLKSIDRSGITTTLKYSFGDPGSTVISPLLGYRQIYGFSDYMDAGVNVSYLSKLDVSLLYHTNKSITGGFSFDYNRKLRLACFYNSETPQLRGLSGGTFELSLGIPFSIRKNQ